MVSVKGNWDESMGPHHSLQPHEHQLLFTLLLCRANENGYVQIFLLALFSHSTFHQHLMTGSGKENYLAVSSVGWDWYRPMGLRCYPHHFIRSWSLIPHSQGANETDNTCMLVLFSHTIWLEKVNKYGRFHLVCLDSYWGAFLDRGAEVALCVP